MTSDMKTVANTSTYYLSNELADAVTNSLKEWKLSRHMSRLWARDATLWTGEQENRWLGWLELTEQWEDRVEELRQLQKQVCSSGIRDLVVLGMGGSSLCPEVLASSFGPVSGFPRLRILDSTDPSQIRALENTLELSRTLFIVSSKSGLTLESNIFQQYFYHRMKKKLGSLARNHFIAITDPGSLLEKLAKKERFTRIFYGIANAGGRYSALSQSGMVPGAAMGLDISDLLKRAHTMVVATSPATPVEKNPGARLGTVMGQAAKQGRDKLTLILSPALSSLGAWLEQLVAESTGKHGKGIIPIDGEQLDSPEVYGNDRIFAYIRLDAEPNAAQDEAVTKLVDAGQPVIRIPISDVRDLGQEFFRWEIATVVASAVLGVNPFDQPDVEASKVAIRTLTSEYENSGIFAKEKPIFEKDSIQLYTNGENANAIGDHRCLEGFLRAHLNQIGSGDYFAILAYVNMSSANVSLLQDIRHVVRNVKRVATCLGFGPRYLHSTGQVYKGGPNTGVFLQVTHNDEVDISIPSQKYTFGILKAAQAQGDFEVLAQRNRRILRAHLGSNLEQDLEQLRNAVRDAVC